MKRLFIFILCCFFLHSMFATYYLANKNLNYYKELGITTDTAALNDPDCNLDLIYPNDLKKFPTVVCLYGGGLTSGSKFFPEEFLFKGFAIVAPNYRKSPKYKYPTYIEDAAAALAWTFKNIEKYGGDPNKIILAGYSAGAYLALMIGLDKKYTTKYDIDVNNLASLVSVTGQAISHFQVRAERGIPATQPIIDESAPLFHVRPDACKIVLLVGDREKELYRRYDENYYFEGMLRLAHHWKTTIYNFEGKDHIEMYNVGLQYILNEVNLFKTDSPMLISPDNFEISSLGHEIKVRFKNICTHKVKILAVDGKELIDQETDNESINFSLTPNSTYIISINDETIKYLHK